MLRRLFFVGFFFAGFAPVRAAEAVIAWQPWSRDVFAQAAREHKFVILDLEAVWCHWCHVMDETTYRDPQVAALLRSRYLAVRVDQDSRPDLSSRYEDYGWPATVVFAADGTEIVRRRGYLPPREMAAMLQAVIDDPTPGPSVGAAPVPTFSEKGGLNDARRAELRAQIIGGYDQAKGGWSDEHKYLDWDNVEFCLAAARRGDTAAARIARDMLRLQRQLIDPAWGGVYQYSAEGDWGHPHFEKIMSVQAENLRIYALARAQWPDEPAYLQAARDIQRYLQKFLLGEDGAFYTSQDADLVPGEHAGDYFALDDAARRARGIPRIDTHRYARENGWAINALCALADVTGDDGALRAAGRAAQWVLAHRALPGGGFRHDETDPAGPYLGDTLAMGRAFFALYQATGDAVWLSRAAAAADFIGMHFARGGEPGFATADTTAKSFPAPQPQFDENVALARFANLLAHATGRASDRALAGSGLRWALAPEVLREHGPYVGGVLLAEEELRTGPLHVTIVGGKDDTAARALLAAARRAPTGYKLIEWWDRREGPPPRGEAIFPDLGRSAAFLCADGACSSPIFAAAALTARLEKAVRITARQ
ncbi:MAG TPA: DUF255 domain-containing protein [Opitutaceae bacterium]|nr:DUF255 domain-containing protein [Opitutaceae bacterium]